MAPDGYTIATDTKFTIDETGKVTSSGSVTEDGIVLIEDAKTKVKVSKTDIADGEEIEGATIQIIDSEGKVVEEWVSGKEPHLIEGLKTGVEYTLRETVAPEGYTIATDTKFTIDETGKVTSTGSVTEDGILLVEDDKPSVKVSKTDIAGGEELEGATIQILDQDGNVVEEWVSAKEPHVIRNLKINVEYTLRETVAPDGYTIATENAKISPIAEEVAVAMMADQLKAQDRSDNIAKLSMQYAEMQENPIKIAKEGYLDNVVEAINLRPYLSSALMMLEGI